MTFGSPIEVHHLLWPELWVTPPPNAPAIHPAADAPVNIPWHNYYDYGDPIAYGLTATSEWLHEKTFDKHLRLVQMPFSRYFLPGTAHTDYWGDDVVFGHFIETVVQPQPGARPFPQAPRSRVSAIISSYLIPNLLVVLLVLGATYLFHRAVSKVVFGCDVRDSRRRRSSLRSWGSSHR